MRERMVCASSRRERPAPVRSCSARRDQPGAAMSPARMSEHASPSMRKRSDLLLPTLSSDTYTSAARHIAAQDIHDRRAHAAATARQALHPPLMMIRLDRMRDSPAVWKELCGAVRADHPFASWQSLWHGLVAFQAMHDASRIPSSLSREGRFGDDGVSTWKRRRRPILRQLLR